MADLKGIFMIILNKKLRKTYASAVNRLIIYLGH